MMTRDTHWPSWAMIALLLAATVLTPTGALASGGGPDPLRLRVHKVIGEPGGLTTIVLRTYAPKDIPQGQICLFLPVSETTGLAPIMELRGAKVFSGAGDALGTATLEQVGVEQRLNVVFSSPSGTINSVEGAMIAIDVDLSGTALVDESFPVAIDTANSLVFDSSGNPLTIAPRDGDLTIRSPGVPFRVEVEGDTIEPGAVAELALSSFEPFAVASGQLALSYDPEVFPGTPVATFDARHGQSTFNVDTAIPGLLIVTFDSPDASFNTVPGKIVGFSLPSAPGVPVGTTSPVSLEPSLTRFLDSAGNLLLLDLRPDQVDFE